MHPPLVKLRKLMGYVNDATDIKLVISQDDATGSIILKVGSRSYSGSCLGEVIDKAYDRESQQ